ncbi:MAG: hypothetical protein UCH28_09650 [Adlercreutzia sp.]|nr:hypothetical protein [Adlercreutzia sp.]
MDLFARDLDPTAKRLLKARAASQGRSQQAEAKAILESTLQVERTSWVSRLRRAAQAVEGIELEEPMRHPARNTKDFDYLGIEVVNPFEWDLRQNCSSTR